MRPSYLHINKGTLYVVHAVSIKSHKKKTCPNLNFPFLIYLQKALTVISSGWITKRFREFPVFHVVHTYGRVWWINMPTEWCFTSGCVSPISLWLGSKNDGEDTLLKCSFNINLKDSQSFLNYVRNAAPRQRQHQLETICKVCSLEVLQTIQFYIQNYFF